MYINIDKPRSNISTVLPRYIRLNRNKNRLLFSSASTTNSVDPDQTAPIGAVCSGSTLFVSILNSSVMLDNYLQQTTSADDIFRCIFFLVL